MLKKCRLIIACDTPFDVLLGLVELELQIEEGHTSGNKTGAYYAIELKRPNEETNCEEYDRGDHKTRLFVLKYAEPYSEAFGTPFVAVGGWDVSRVSVDQLW